VSLFDDAQWHDVELNITPDSNGGATVVFDLDDGVYGGYGILLTYGLPSPAYLGFTARTGGATNNHWVKDILTLKTPVVTVAPSEFDLTLDEAEGYEGVTNSAAVIQVADVVGDVLQITDATGAQRGTAFKQIAGLTAADGFSVKYQMYTGGGTGADGQCVNIGANTLGGRFGEDGVAVGLALCFDEYANGDAEHGIQMFYNGEMIFEGRATCGNREGCPPVSLFEDDDESWHDVELNITPDDNGGATVVFTLDRGVYGGYGIIAAYDLPSPAYLGFTGRTGGATNNHWVKGITTTIGGLTTTHALLQTLTAIGSNIYGLSDIEISKFVLDGSAKTSRDVLQITQLENSQSGTAFMSLAGLTTSDGLTVRYQMYTGDGTGADGQCVNIGANSLGGRAGEDGVAEGLAVCFDEWANGDAEHGIQMFYNGEMIFEGRATCENRKGCPPVSFFDDELWHDVEVNISPDGMGGATVIFTLDVSIYSGYGILDKFALPSTPYLGFTGRTGGATNNHFVKNIQMMVTPLITVPVVDFTLDGSAMIEEESYDASVAVLGGVNGVAAPPVDQQVSPLVILVTPVTPVTPVTHVNFSHFQFVISMLDTLELASSTIKRLRTRRSHSP
jgi:hypothetical protein